MAADILRILSEDEAERSAYVYVLRPDGLAVGVDSVRDVFLAQRDEEVDRIMTSGLMAVRPEDDAMGAVHLFRNQGFKLLPVLGAGDRLLGVITRDDAFDLLAEELARGFVRSAQGSPDGSFFTPPMGAVRWRLPWMGATVLPNLGVMDGSVPFTIKGVRTAGWGLTHGAPFLRTAMGWAGGPAFLQGERGGLRLSALVTERDLDLGPVANDLAILQLDIELAHFGNVEVPELLRSGCNGFLCGLLPRLGAGSNQLDDLADAVAHGALPSRFLDAIKTPRRRPPRTRSGP